MSLDRFQTKRHQTGLNFATWKIFASCRLSVVSGKPHSGSSTDYTLVDKIRNISIRVEAQRSALSTSISKPSSSSLIPSPDYAATGWNCFFTMSPVPENKATFWVADAAVVKEVTGNRNLFPKPLDLYWALRIYGDVSISVSLSCVY